MWFSMVLAKCEDPAFLSFDWLFCCYLSTMISVRFYEGFKFGFPGKAFVSIANVSLVAAPTKTPHLNRLRPQTSSPEGLRLEILAMALLLDYNDPSSKSIAH